MRKSVAWGLVVTLAVVAFVATGVTVASNMGFKFVPQVTANKAFNLSLPWNGNYSKANDILTDTSATSVQRFTEDAGLVTWTGAGVNFSVLKGESYILRAGAGGLTPTIVGSHDPNHTIDVLADKAFNAAAPYHQTFTKAGELLGDLQAFSANVSSVQRFTEDAGLVTWTGAGVNFPLALGEGVIIRTVGGGVTGYSWPHY